MPHLGPGAINRAWDGLDEGLIESNDHKRHVLVPDHLCRCFVAEGRAAAGGSNLARNARPGGKAFGLAVRKGVKIAFGTDAGGFPWTEMRRKSSVLWSGME